VLWLRALRIAEFTASMYAINRMVEPITGRAPFQLSSFVPMFSVYSSIFDYGNAWDEVMPKRFGILMKDAISDYIRYDNLDKFRKLILNTLVPAGVQMERMIETYFAMRD